MMSRLGLERIGFDDFRTNGLLLPATVAAARKAAKPLHRGPHRLYNAMVMERMGQIEGEWSRTRNRAPVAAIDTALFRIAPLQRALRAQLLGRRFGRGRVALSARDPFLTGQDFSELDAMADQLWAATTADVRTAD